MWNQLIAGRAGSGQRGTSIRHPLSPLVLACAAAVIFAGCVASENSSDAITTVTDVAPTTPSTATTAVPKETLDDGEGTIATSTEETATFGENQSIWMYPHDGILMTVTPARVPPVLGTHEVTVHGFWPEVNIEPPVVWVAACRGAQGVVNVNAWELIDSDIGRFCGFDDDQFVRADFEQGMFETTLLVEVDEPAISDGGIVITAGDIWIPVAGNVLLRITDAPSTPWDKAQHRLNLNHLISTVSYWPPFVQNFNSTYTGLGDCDEAYDQAKAGDTGFRTALGEWDDEQRDKPGYGYDTALAQLWASNIWLNDNSCPGSADFVSFG